MGLKCWENEWAMGSDLPHAKLNEELVKRLRKEYAEAQKMISELRRKHSYAGYAEDNGVSANCMERAIKGITWRHVK